MGLLKRLLGDHSGDPARIEKLIEDGNTDRAIELARRLSKADGGRFRDRAEALLVRALEAAVERRRERARLMCGQGHDQDAMEYLEAALEDVQHASADFQQRVRPELESTLSELRQRLSDAAVVAHRQEIGGRAAAPSSDEADQAAVDVGYEVLVDMMRDDIAALYREQPPEFERAVLALSEGEAERSLTLLEPLGDAPIVELQRGRAHLLEGNFEQARQSFERIWRELGEEALDLQGTLSVPDLWSEAALAQGEHEAIVGRVSELARPQAGRPLIVAAFADALIALERRQAAEEHLRAATRAFPGDPGFSYRLAGVLLEGGETSAAIEVLEQSVKLSTRPGSCGPAGPRLHPPSLELLAELMLDAADCDSDRIAELLDIAATARGGVTAKLARLGAAVARRNGDEETALANERLAEQIDRQGELARSEAAPTLRATERPPL